MQSAFFLDRDGVIIENRPQYVRAWEDVAIFDQAVRALKKLSASPYRIVLVTNQAAVGKGILSLDQAEYINHQLCIRLQELGCRVDGVYMCPHTPDAGCACRKPKPGLLLQAAAELGIQLSGSHMIGDAWSDLQAGFAAGVAATALVRTGRGSAQELLPRPGDIGVAAVFNSLADAVDAWLA